MGVQVGLRRLDRFVTEPQRDHGAVDARLQQLHRRTVPQDVRRHPLRLQRRTALASDLHMLRQKRLDAVGAESPPVHVGEQSGSSLPYRLFEPCLERTPSERSQRRGPFLPPLADTPYMRAGAEVDGVPVETDQLGEAQARLDRGQQQGVIAAAEPRRPIGRGEDCLDLGARQEVHLSLVVALARYGEHALDHRAVRWLLERHEPEEGADGGQAQVARLGAGTALRLKIDQECTDERCIQVAECQSRGGLTEPRLCEREQQPERIPIGCDRVGADVALAHEPLGEVALDQRGDIAGGLHGAASHRRSRRRAASSINSGQAERYQ